MASRQNGAFRAGKAPSQRQLRVGEELRHTLAALFQRGDFHDPELQKLRITVTEVRVSPDLSNATAFITPLGGGHVEEALAALRRAAPFLRGQVARAVKLRHAPTLSFEADTSFDYANHIANILHSPDVARDLTERVNGDGDHDDDEDDGWDEEDEESDDAEYEEDDLDEEDEDSDDEDAEYEDEDSDDEDDDGAEENEYEDDPEPARPRGKGGRGA